MSRFGSKAITAGHKSGEPAEADGVKKPSPKVMPLDVMEKRLLAEYENEQTRKRYRTGGLKYGRR